MRPFFQALVKDDALLHEAGGLGLQYAGDFGWIKEMHAKHPDVPIMFTESRCQIGANSEAAALQDFRDFIAYSHQGCRAFSFWNMVLGDSHKNLWNWCQDSLVLVDTGKKSVTYEPSFAVARLLANSLPAGSRYLPSTTKTGDAVIGASGGTGWWNFILKNGEQIASFRRPDGSIVILLWNQGQHAMAEILICGETVHAILPEKAIAVITCHHN